MCLSKRKKQLLWGITNITQPLLDVPSNWVGEVGAFRWNGQMFGSTWGWVTAQGSGSCKAYLRQGHIARAEQAWLTKTAHHYGGLVRVHLSKHKSWVKNKYLSNDFESYTAGSVVFLHDHGPAHSWKQKRMGSRRSKLPVCTLTLLS